MKQYTVIKDILNGLETSAQIGDILTVKKWGQKELGSNELTLMKDDKAVCDLDSKCTKECCREL